MSETSVIGLLVTAIVSLSGVVGILWRIVFNYFTRIQKKLDECEKDRDHLWQVVADIQGETIPNLKKRHARE